MLKRWYKSSEESESCALADVYPKLSGGKLDGSLPIPEEYLGAVCEVLHTYKINNGYYNYIIIITNKINNKCLPLLQSYFENRRMNNKLNLYGLI